VVTIERTHRRKVLDSTRGGVPSIC
jgi:hypothetical protein